MFLTNRGESPPSHHHLDTMPARTRSRNHHNHVSCLTRPYKMLLLEVNKWSYIKANKLCHLSNYLLKLLAWGMHLWLKQTYLGKGQTVPLNIQFIRMLVVFPPKSCWKRRVAFSCMRKIGGEVERIILTVIWILDFFNYIRDTFLKALCRHQTVCVMSGCLEVHCVIPGHIKWKKNNNNCWFFTPLNSQNIIWLYIYPESLVLLGNVIVYLYSHMFFNVNERPIFTQLTMPRNYAVLQCRKLLKQRGDGASVSPHYAGTPEHITAEFCSV